MLIKNRFFWLYIGRNWQRQLGYVASLVILPRPKQTPMGELIRGSLRFEIELRQVWLTHFYPAKQCVHSERWTGRSGHNHWSIRCWGKIG